MSKTFNKKIVAWFILTISFLSYFYELGFADAWFTWEQLKTYSQGFIGENEPLVKLNTLTDTFVGYFNKSGEIEGYTFPTSGIAYENQYPEGLKNQYTKLLEGKKLIIPAYHIASAELLNKSELTNDFPELNNQNSMNHLAFVLTNFPYSNWKSSLHNIKSKTTEITNGAITEEEKVKRIYDWITNNIIYDEYSSQYINWKITEATYKANVTTSVYNPFGTFDNKKGVCQGISYLFYFMLEFAGVKGSGIETGYLLTKYLSHQWNRVGDYYFDVTADLSAKNRYLHYKLPKEIMNLDREQGISSQVYLTKKGSDFSTQLISNTLNYVKSTSNYNYRNTYYYQWASSLKGSFSLKNFEFAYWKVLDINEYGQFTDYAGNQNRFSSLRTFAMKDDIMMENALVSWLLTSKTVSLATYNGRSVMIDLITSVSESPLNKPVYEPIFENLKSNSILYSKPEIPLFDTATSSLIVAPIPVTPIDNIQVVPATNITKAVPNNPPPVINTPNVTVVKNSDTQNLKVKTVWDGLIRKLEILSKWNIKKEKAYYGKVFAFLDVKIKEWKTLYPELKKYLVLAYNKKF
ncbi:MAG: hypothetical protein ACD_71C00179G0009 [uncultured bacterium (gcode 4)]|uniref:Transglutaminase-like domain-containing protein n=1 Tax=uncultured bacterium (gcode 4) TaxID=1234023 RepID=K2A2S5_9BACT|nr:MAG: hypothetical protein ACD_71C00179G0009 [uncultured bacterium (gcode 4)]